MFSRQVVHAMLSIGIAFGAATLSAHAAAGDRAQVRGWVDSVDPPTKTVKLRTRGGDTLTLRADDRTVVTDGGKRVTLDKLTPGAKVRATYERAGDLNRLVSINEAVPTEADLGKEVRAALETARGYGHAQKDKYREKLRGVLDDVDDHIDDLEDRAARAGEDAKPALKEQLADLKAKRDELAKRLEKARPAVAEAWEDVKSGMAGAAEDLGKALDRFRSTPK